MKLPTRRGLNSPLLAHEPTALKVAALPTLASVND